MSPIEKFLSNKIKLPSPPAIAIKILETVRQDKFTFQDLANVIESDPALAARVLKASNSSYYNMSGKVTSIEKSLAILGTHVVRNIALSFVLCSEFQSESYGTFDATYFWRRALSSAVTAELTAKTTGSKVPDIFITAMLQDIGIMVMYNCRPIDYQSVLDVRKEKGLSLLEAENTIFEFDHQEVGVELLKCWMLPDEIYDPIRYHHSPNSVAGEYRTHTAILSIADSLSSFFNRYNDVSKIRYVKQIFDTEFGLKGVVVDDFIESVAHKTLEIFSSFEIAPKGLKPFSQILQDANAELSNLYDSYELQIIELKQAKHKLEEQAKELRESNARLSELASKDALTGLLNYRSFQEALDLEMVRSKRYGREFSLLFFDVDHFKKINDVHGHPVGDQVLIQMGLFLRKTIRQSDIFARYGGDEFVIIMPETDRGSALVVAENMRNGIENLEIAVGDEILKVSISIGLASFEPANKSIDKKTMIYLADKALIKAKHSGKNKIFAM